jgi:hypothetical protein
MGDTSAVPKTIGPSNNAPSLAWTVFRDFIIFTLALSGGLALIGLYSKGQSVSQYLLQGAFVSCGLVLLRVRREKNKRDQKSKTYLDPGN